MWDLRIMSGKPSKIWWAGPGGKTCERVKKSLGSLGGWKCSKATTGIYLAVSPSGKRPICSIQLTERVTFQDWQGNYDEDRMKWLKISVLERTLEVFSGHPRYCVQYARRSLFAGKTQGCMALWHRSISPFNLRIQSEIEELRRLWHVDYNDDGSILSIFRWINLLWRILLMVCNDLTVQNNRCSPMKLPLQQWKTVCPSAAQVFSRGHATFSRRDPNPSDIMI